MTKPTLQKHYRYVITYECEDTDTVKTYSVWAATASEATAKVINYIKTNGHHHSLEPYVLIPKISKEITNFDII